MFLGMLNYNLMMMGCGIEVESPVKHFGRLSVTGQRRFCAGLAADSPDYS